MSTPTICDVCGDEVTTKVFRTTRRASNPGQAKVRLPLRRRLARLLLGPPLRLLRRDYTSEYVEQDLCRGCMSDLPGAIRRLREERESEGEEVSE